MKDNLKIIILAGIKHCGKTTLGKRLAAYYGSLFFDTDDVIFQRTGKKAREIYTESGAAAFMEAEAEACKSIVQQLEDLKNDGATFPCAVVATGGGFCNNEKAREVFFGKSTIVFLNTSENVASDRIVKEIGVASDGSFTGLPAYIAKENPKTIEDVRAIFHDFYEKRSAIYTAMADITIRLPQASKEENTQRLINALDSL